MPSTRAVRSFAVLAVFLAGVASVESPPKSVEAKPRFKFDDGYGGGLAYSPDGSILAAGNLDGTIRLLSAADGKPAGRGAIGVANGRLSTYRTAPGPILFSPDGSIVVAGNFGVEIQYRDRPRNGADLLQALDVASGRVLYTIPLVGDARSLAVTPDGKTLRASVRIDKDKDVVHSWDLATGSPGATITLPSRGTSVTAFSRDGATIATARPDDPAITIHQLPSGRAKMSLSSPLKRGPVGMVFSPEGRTLAAVNKGNVVELWDLDSPKLRASISPPRDDTPPIIYEMVFSADGRRLVLTGGRMPEGYRTGQGLPGRLILVDVLKGMPTGAIEGMEPGANDQAISPDGRRLARSDTEFGGGTIPMSTLAAWDLPPGP